MIADNILLFPGTMAVPVDGHAPGTRFRAFNLSAPDAPRRTFRGAGGRFGAIARIVGSPSPAETGAAEPTVEAVEAVAPPPRARVLRRPAFAAYAPEEPVRVAPMPLAAAEAHAAGFAPRHVSVPAAPEQKKGFGTAVFLMVLVWAGIIAAGTLYFTTPRGGAKIEWR